MEWVKGITVTFLDSKRISLKFFILIPDKAPRSKTITVIAKTDRNAIIEKRQQKEGRREACQGN